MTRSLYSYITGFALSLLLTAVPLGLLYWHEATFHHFPTHEMLYIAFSVLAVLQLLVQLSFFLHIDQEEGPRYNLLALIFALIVVCILVGGTLWIMYNLSHGQISGEPYINNQITPQGEND